MRGCVAGGGLHGVARRRCRRSRCRGSCYLDNSTLTCSFRFSVGLLAGLAEVGQQLPDPARDRLMAFNFAGPVAFGGVLDQLLFAAEALTQARRVFAGGEELAAAQIQVTLARPFGRQPQTVAEFELGLEVVALQPVQSVLTDLVVE